MASFQTRNGSTRAIVRKAGYKSITASFDTETEARDWAARTEARITAGLVADPGPTGPGTATRVLIDKYIDEYVSVNHRSDRVSTMILTNLYERFDVFEKPVSRFGQEDAQAVIDGRLRGDMTNGHHFPKVKSSTVLRECGTLSGFFTWVIKGLNIALPAGNPMTLVYWPKKSPARTQRASEAEINSLLGALDYVRGTVPETSKQWVGWCILLAVETALRQGNLLAIRYGDVYAKHVHVEMTKNGYSHNAPLSSRARALFALLPYGEANERIVPVNTPNFRHIFDLAREEVGLEHINFHDFKRESITRAAPFYRDAMELSKFSGHRDLKSLAVYYAPDVDGLADKLG
jgi:hypothetical protein